jgi:diacylglycerol kinase family enzyme
VIEAQASADPVGIEIDGERLGTLPARIEVVPDAIALFGCR